MSDSQRELLKDFSRFRRQKTFFDEGKAVITFDPSDILNVKMSLLPKHGFFRNCLVRFKLNFGNYPTSKPSVNCLTKVFHPNVSSSGSVCFSLFGSHWSASFRLVEIADALLFFLCKPNPGDALNSSCRINDDKRYDDHVQRAANGENIGGTKYDKCKVQMNIKDSKELQKELDVILYSFDKEKMILELEKKVEDARRDKVDSLVSSNNIAYQSLLKLHRRIVGICMELKKTKSGDVSPERVGEEQKLFAEAKTLLRLLEGAYDIEKKFEEIVKHVERISKSTSSSQRPVYVQRNEERVRNHFERAFPIYREAMEKYYEALYEGDNETDLGDRIKNNLLKRFRDIIHIESRFRSYLLRVFSRLSENNNNESNNLVDIFTSCDFSELTRKLDPLYEELVFNFDSPESEQESQKRILEGIKLLDDLLRNCDIILDLECEFVRCRKEIEVSDLGTETILRMYVDQKICTFKRTGKKGAVQSWYRCCYCRVHVCEVCKVNCHEGHKTSSVRKGSFWCHCGAGKGTFDECKCMGKEFDGRRVDELVNRRKANFLQREVEIRQKLDELHSKVMEEGRIIREFEKDIKSCFSEAVGFL